MEPIVVEFEVATTPEHAFMTWTEKTTLWWPRSHTFGSDSLLEIAFEPRPGGRIFERDAGGTEHEWGEVVTWEPPHRVGFVWHLFFDREEATDIEITFSPSPVGTMVRLVQTGFDRLPADVGLVRRNRTEGAWGEVTGGFRRFLESQA